MATFTGGSAIVGEEGISGFGQSSNGFIGTFTQVGIPTRNAIARYLQQNPSLKSRMLEEGFAVRVDLALRGTDLPIRAFPPSCPYEWSLIMTDSFLCDTSQDWE